MNRRSRSGVRSAARRSGARSEVWRAAARAALALGVVWIVAAPLARAEDKGAPPDTASMNAMMRQMPQMMEQMQASMPEAKLRKLQYQAGGEWKTFELAPAELKTGMGVGTMAKAMIGLGRPKSWFVVDGEKSDLVLSDAKPHFRFAGIKKDAMSIQLALFEVADGKRHAPIDTAKQVDFFKHGIDLEVTKAGDDVWDLAPKKPLEPGQYGLANSPAGSVADFAIGEGK
ncbi:MAG TPA: hypothetical protein VF363_02295 [Candidatus Eisenbacteria bacterium]